MFKKYSEVFIEIAFLIVIIVAWTFLALKGN